MSEHESDGTEGERGLEAMLGDQDPEIMQAIAPPLPGDARAITAKLDRWVTLAKHGFLRELKAPGLAGRLFNVVSFLWLPAGAAVKLGFGWYTSIGVVLLVILGARKTWKQSTAPQNKELQEHRFGERKLSLMDLIGRMGGWRTSLPTDTDTRRFQRDALHVVADFVRDYRGDHNGSLIFANLLVPVNGGKQFRVVCRDKEHRSPAALYPADTVGAVSKAFRTGDAVVVDDVQAEYPGTAADKMYRSILAIPLNDGVSIHAVLSIDSSESYHFSTCADELITGISPYRALLIQAMMIQRAADRAAKEI